MRKTIGLWMILALLVPLAYGAIRTDITVKPSFSDGETMGYNYTIVSDTDLQVIFIPTIQCSKAPGATLLESTIQLKANQTYKGTYTDQVVGSTFEPQNCTAYIRFVSPMQNMVSKKFQVITEPSVTFSLKTCKDSSCDAPQKIFIGIGKIYLGYDSQLSGIAVGATMQYPDGSSKAVSIPGEFEISSFGTYRLEAKAASAGYKEAKASLEFSAISEEPNIQDASECNGNARCDKGENPQNCPQDCARGTPLWLIVLVVITFAAVIALVLILYRKK
jgi:hypothetical protein